MVTSPPPPPASSLIILSEEALYSIVLWTKLCIHISLIVDSLFRLENQLKDVNNKQEMFRNQIKVKAAHST
jgi:hypothetical protein